MKIKNFGMVVLLLSLVAVKASAGGHDDTFYPRSSWVSIPPRTQNNVVHPPPAPAPIALAVVQNDQNGELDVPHNISAADYQLAAKFHAFALGTEIVRFEHVRVFNCLLDANVPYSDTVAYAYTLELNSQCTGNGKTPGADVVRQLHFVDPYSGYEFASVSMQNGEAELDFPFAAQMNNHTSQAYGFWIYADIDPTALVGSQIELNFEVQVATGFLSGQQAIVRYGTSINKQFSAGPLLTIQ